MLQPELIIYVTMQDINVNMQVTSHADMNTLHVNIINLHVDINKLENEIYASVTLNLVVARSQAFPSHRMYLIDIAS